MKTCLFTGVCTALVTPFAEGTVDITALERLLDFQTENGVSCFVLAGTTGEAPTLSDDEKRLLWKTVRRHCPKATLLMGAGSNCTAHTLRLAAMAEDCGADGLLVVTPYYNKATAAGLIAHYTAVADAVRCPLVIYNVPSRTGVNIPLSVYPVLAQHERIVGVKEASGSLRTAAEILAACPAGFSLWSGNDDLTVPIMALGGKGVISVTSNVMPKEMTAMTDAALRGDFPDAAKRQLAMLPLMDALFSEVNPIPVKEALNQIGLPCGICRLPLTPMTHPEALHGLLSAISPHNQNNT